MSEGSAVQVRRGGGDRSRARVVVVGDGPLAREVARHLELADIPIATHRQADFWARLTLADLQECYCAVAAGLDPGPRRRLNKLAQIAAVDFVNVVLDDDGIRLETYPFGSDRDCACLECAADMDEVQPPLAPPDPIAASVAGGLAAAAALRCAGTGARCLHLHTLGDPGIAQALPRRPDCRACAGPARAPTIIRTRNRWSAGQPLEHDAADLHGQTLRLSEAVVTNCECAACGPVAAPVQLLHRPVSELAPVSVSCPTCGLGPLRIEARDTFSLGELMSRFGSGPVPAKFALARIGGVAVCFDLEPGVGAGDDRT